MHQTEATPTTPQERAITIDREILKMRKQIGYFIVETEGGPNRSELLRKMKSTVDALSTLIYHAQRRDAQEEGGR